MVFETFLYHHTSNLLSLLFLLPHKTWLQFTQQYKVECCGVDTQLCDVFVQVTSGNRKLICDGCFSPMSTVIEQTKGKMLLKDLKFGDSVLAANQVFQPYVFDIHSHSSKPTEYLQLHTEVSDNDSETAPIELTPGHMIFVDGKDMPILASDVKLGDSLVGTSGPMKVTKISTVMRDGLFNTLTADGKSISLCHSLVWTNPELTLLNLDF